MSDPPAYRGFHRLRELAAVLVLLLAALCVAPFLVPTPLVRLALAHLLPAHRPSLGSAALNPVGTLVLHDLKLHDTGAVAQQPLLTARRVEVAFGWAAVLSGQLREIHAEDVTVYARSNGQSPLSLLALVSERSPAGLSAESHRRTRPLWIDTLSVQGRLDLEPAPGFVPSRVQWPLRLRMSMSGDRLDPARHFCVALGEVWPWSEQSRKKLAGEGTEPVLRAERAFGLRADFDTQPAPGATRVVVRRLRARQGALRMAADALRRYVPQLAPVLPGPISISFGELDLSGLIGAGTGEARGFSGQLRLQDLSVRSPVGGQPGLALERLTVAGSVDALLDRWAPTVLQVREGVLQWAALSYGNVAVKNLDAAWHIAGQRLRTERCAAQIFDGQISGALVWDLGTHAVPRCDFEVKSINMHEALSNLSPEHLDAEGRASGTLQLRLNRDGELSGSVELTFDGPGLLHIGEIEEVKRLLVGHFGHDLASLAMRDLQQYPFTQGRVYLENVGNNSQVKITFVRQPRTEADATPPRKELLNGQEVWVGSLVVPTIDLTIPIRGKSLAAILALVSGIRPLTEAGREQPGK